MNILFLCTHNACRSILAESIANSIGKNLWQAFSAGSTPAGKVHPETIYQLISRHYPVEGLLSKSWDELTDIKPDIVITVCDQAAGEACPVWFGQAIKGYWGLPDPTKALPDEREAVFKLVMNTLEQRLLKLADAVNTKSMEELPSLITRLAKENVNGLF
ncbi:MAG: arsenate reductase ArsC [Enterobacterales bacterium]|nr:arsenate reductase ArsC [Enterobacterales bacterium]